MCRLNVLAIVLVLSAGMARAQAPPGDPTAAPNMTTPTGQSTSIAPPSEASPPPRMTAVEAKTMRSCGAMPHSTMMANPTCKLLIAKHPEIVDPQGAMKAAPVTPQ